MGKTYNHLYHFAPYDGSTGTMVCASCHKPIDNQKHDWKACQKTIGDDWKFIVHHRECSGHEEEFLRIKAAWEATEARTKERSERIIAFAKREGLDNVQDFLWAIETAFDIDLHEMYSY